MRRCLWLGILVLGIVLLAFPMVGMLDAQLYIPLTLRGIPTPTVTARPTKVASPTLTLTPTPEATLPVLWQIYGTVYDETMGIDWPVADANVSLLMCSSAGGRRWSAMTDHTGHYLLSVPTTYLNACGVVSLEVWANGFAPSDTSVSVASLYAQPERHLGLEPVAPTQTIPAQATPTPEPGSLVLTGAVFDADQGPSAGIHYAVIKLTPCEPYDAILVMTDAQGHYRLVVPATHLTDCPEMTIQVVAMGYRDYSMRVPVSELQQQPERDYAMRETNQMAVVWQ